MVDLARFAVGCLSDFTVHHAWVLWPGHPGGGRFGDSACVPADTHARLIRVACVGAHGKTQRFALVRRSDVFRAVILAGARGNCGGLGLGLGLRLGLRLGLAGTRGTCGGLVLGLAGGWIWIDG